MCIRDRIYITAYAPTVSASSASSYPVKDKVKFNGASIKSELIIDKLKASADYTNDDTELADQIYGAGKTPTLTGFSQPARVTITNGEVTQIVALTSDELQTQNDDKEQIAKCKAADSILIHQTVSHLTAKQHFQSTLQQLFFMFRQTEHKEKNMLKRPRHQLLQQVIHTM